MADLVDRLRSGRLLGATGRPVSALVSLGIGGSYLGPAMATGALAHQAHPDLDVRFASNLDGADITAALRGLDPTTTLVLICSKTFTTAETMVLAESARTWLADGVGTDVSAHLAAATTASGRAAAFGIDPALTFSVPDWVGGRFSLRPAAGGGQGDCRLRNDALIAVCSIGAGHVVALADATLFESDPAPAGAEYMLVALLGMARDDVR